MKFTECMIAWNPETDRIVVGPWPDKTKWSAAYRMTDGACSMQLNKMTKEQQIMMLFIHFNTCVVRDGVPPEAAHRAFLAIDEYRRFISPDQLGAEDEDGPCNKPWQKVVQERLSHRPSAPATPDPSAR